MSRQISLTRFHHLRFRASYHQYQHVLLPYTYLL